MALRHHSERHKRHVTICPVAVVSHLQSVVPPQYVFWYHNGRMINYDAAAGVRVRTERAPRTQSALLVRAARPRHQGNYSCRAANIEPATIAVYVGAGQTHAPTTRFDHYLLHVTFIMLFFHNYQTFRPTNTTSTYVVVTGDKMAATLSRDAAARAAPPAGLPLLLLLRLLMPPLHG